MVFQVKIKILVRLYGYLAHVKGAQVDKAKTILHKVASIALGVACRDYQ
jgi:hypothetical protein